MRELGEVDMTGLERLRELAGKMANGRECEKLQELHGNGDDMCVFRGCDECRGAALMGIADQIEHETAHDHSKDVSMSAYDLIPEEDRKAIAWVREKGGVNALSWGFQDADNRRIELCSSLDIDLETGWADAMVAMRRRLMPEGMEWPRFETGEPVKLGDEFENAKGNASVLKRIMIKDTGKEFGGEIVWSLNRGETAVEILQGGRIKRPAPKVFDADGVEIRVGDVLYSIETGDSVTVDSIEPGNPWFATTDGTLQHCAKLTHRAPVLAADGKPLREGETVYKVGGDGTAYVFDGMSDYVDGLAMLHHDGKPYVGTGLRVDKLTHERPVLDADGVLCREGDEVWEVRSHRRREIVGTHYRDYETGEPLILCDGDDAIPIPATCVTHAKPEPPDSWERLEEDAKAWVNPTMEERAELIRRAKKLAGVS